MAELTAVGKYIQFWWPEIPTWASAAVFFIAINAINLTNVKVFGEMEFWFAIIKVVAVVAMILFGGWLLFSGNGGPQATVRNLWDQGGFLPHGFYGLVMMMAIIMFSFGGLELVGITAAEADNPEQSIPKATNQVIYRILIFYVGSLAVLLSLLPWTRVTADTSPFVLIFHELGDTLVANALNVVVLTAALSVYNSCVYCNSRMLFGLAQQGNAPKALLSVDKRGVPVNTILVSALVTALCVLINYLAPESAFGLLMALVVSALVINWGDDQPRAYEIPSRQKAAGRGHAFPGPLLSAGQLAVPAVYGGGAGDYADDPGMAISVWLIPVWIAVLGVGYLFKEKAAATIKAQ
ncbi:Aromatic amino acid transport protein AroP [Klebsiella pneumoniae]|nr:Aromatic amino acid transport protein AroP [Klebsiella pneumoniae]